MFNLVETIFNDYFTPIFHTEDTNKIDDKGLLQRFAESLTELWDTDVISVLQTFIDSTLVPVSVLSKFIPYLELHVGMPVIHEDLTIRRNILRRASEIWRYKGTLRSYELMFSALGFSGVEIIPVAIGGGFDNSTGFDSETRRFDGGKCQKCRYYTLNLTGEVAINNAMYEAIRNALYLIDPIYVRLMSITVNDVAVDLLDIFIAENGDLVYTALSDNNIGFILEENGDLTVVGDDANLYTIDTNGNIMYNGG